MGSKAGRPLMVLANVGKSIASNARNYLGFSRSRASARLLVIALYGTALCPMRV